MTNNIELVEFAKKALADNSCYIFGTFGQIVTNELIEQKSKEYPDQMTPARVEIAKREHIGKTAYDCSGLVKACIFNGKYNPKEDRNARGMYNACDKKGLIADIPNVAGLLVFNKSLTHVGIYIGNNQVIEAKGFSYGLRKSNLSSFYYYGFYNSIEYVDTPRKSDESYIDCVVNSTSGLYIRNAPSLDADIVGVFNYGDKTAIIEDGAEWVKTPRGYCKKEYLTIRG